MEDAGIIELLFSRSERAIAELAGKYGAGCRRIAGNILGDARDVEECVNDTYLGVWNAVPPRRPDPLRAMINLMKQGQPSLATALLPPEPKR